MAGGGGGSCVPAHLHRVFQKKLYRIGAPPRRDPGSAPGMCKTGSSPKLMTTACKSFNQKRNFVVFV